MEEGKTVQTKKGLVEVSGSLFQLARKAKDCRNCDLWERATQEVFGEGPPKASIMLIGEQPGNEEDKQARPFVGPAGRLMDRLLGEAGIDREKTYVTNVVKHFKFEPRGKKRIHAKPNAKEIAACRPWLEAEIARLAPAVIVCLGATAAQALLGKQFRVTKQHGEFIDSPLAARVLATIHPSSILRAPNDEVRHQLEKQFVNDLKLISNLKLEQLPICESARTNPTRSILVRSNKRSYSNHD